MERIQDNLTELPISALTNAIEKLTAKIETLTTIHIKIIYWLLILISTAFIGTKGIELYKLFHN